MASQNGYEKLQIPDFFGVAVFITTYHLLSANVSLRVRTRSSQAVRKLLELATPTARVVRRPGGGDSLAGRSGHRVHRRRSRRVLGLPWPPWRAAPEPEHNCSWAPS